MDIKKLIKYGFDDYFSNEYINDTNKNNCSQIPARVIAQMGDIYTLMTENGKVQAK